MATRAVTRRRALAERPWLAETLWVSGAGAVSLLLALWALQAWDMSLAVPLRADGDGLFSLVLAKLLDTQGWLGVNHDLAYPFGSSTYDQPTHYADFTQLLMLKLLTGMTDSPGVVVNVFFLATFPLVAASAYVVLRALGFARPVVAACAVVYALLPFHFVRGEGHLFLSAYYAVPVGAWLVLGVLGGVPLALRRAGKHGVSAWLTRTTLITAAACLLAGSSDVYFAVLIAAVALAAGVVRALADRRLRAARPAVIVAAAVLATLAAVEAPTILWHMRHGGNATVTQRLPWESEAFGLKLANLVLPQPGHRAPPLADIGERYYEQTQLPGEGPSPALGLLLTIGLGIVAGAAVASAAGRVARTGRDRLLRDSGVAAGAAFMIATIGGASTLFAYLVWPQLRAWGRISPLIAFFALIGLATLLERLWTRRRTLVAAPALVLVALFAAWDQTTADTVPDYGETSAAWRSDARFVAEAERLLPPRAAVLQLPLAGFPEQPPIHRMLPYEHLRGYVHSDSLRWSFGAMRTRLPEDWGGAVLDRPADEVAAAAAAAGFGAVYVDTHGYADGGAQTIASLSALLGGPPALRSRDGRLVLFHLGPVGARLDRALGPARRAATGDALLRPVRQRLAEGFNPANPPVPWRTARGRAQVEFHNPLDLPRRIRWRTLLRTAGPGISTVTLRGPGGFSRRFRTGSVEATSVTLVLTLPPGTSRLHLTSDAPDERGDPDDVRLYVAPPSWVDLLIERADDALRLSSAEADG